MRLRRSIPAALLACAMVFAIQARAENPSPLRELAQKIVQHAQTRSAVAISSRNLANVSASDFAGAQRELETQLRSLGARLVKPEQAVDNVLITLSETPRGLLWIAEIEHSGAREIAMVPAGRFDSQIRGAASSSISVRRTLLWKQATRMLDVASVQIGNSRGLLILESEHIAMRMLPEGTSQSFAIPHSRPWPRDLRGRLRVSANGGYEAQLPGVKCAGTLQSISATVCQENDDPWTLGSLRAFYNGSRNYFTGMLVPALGGEKIPPFFSVAELRQPSTTLFAFSGVDGRTRIVSEQGENLNAVGGWGSDITGVVSDCGTGYILSTQTGDSDHADSIQTFDVVNREPIEASAPVEVPGPVVALWTSAEGATAIAILQNIKTSEYEAYSISVSCGR